MIPDRYEARRQRRLSKVTYMHHVAWGIACLILIAVVISMTTYSQSLTQKNAVLEQRLAVATQRTTCKIDGAWTAGTSKQLSVETASGNRDFIVHVPKNFVDNQYYPLMLFYPGKGASAPAAEAAYGLDNLPAVVVYPFPTEGQDGALAWEGAPYSSDSDDVAFTRSILDKVQSDLCIDRTRVYAAGMSNGGGFASLLSCKLPDRFAAYAIVSGALYAPTSDCVPPRPAPLISIHGDSDVIVPYDGSVLRQLPPIDAWTATRAQQNGCTRPTTTYPDTRTIQTTWNECKDSATVQNVRIQGGEHMWGQISNEALWQFLSRYSL